MRVQMRVQMLAALPSVVSLIKAKVRQRVTVAVITGCISHLAYFTQTTGHNAFSIVSLGREFHLSDTTVGSEGTLDLVYNEA